MPAQPAANHSTVNGFVIERARKAIHRSCDTPNAKDHTISSNNCSTFLTKKQATLLNLLPRYSQSPRVICDLS